MRKSIIFRDVKLDLYEIDEYGNIWSHYLNDWMKQKIDRDGYLTIGLSNGSRNNRTYVAIHTLVAYHFIGPPPAILKDPTINHIDHNMLNNHYKNLEWVERAVNASQRKRTPRGKKMLKPN